MRYFLMILGAVGVVLALIVGPPMYRGAHRAYARRKRLRQPSAMFVRNRSAWQTAEWAALNTYFRTACVASHRA